MQRIDNTLVLMRYTPEKEEWEGIDVLDNSFSTAATTKDGIIAAINFSNEIVFYDLKDNSFSVLEDEELNEAYLQNLAAYVLTSDGKDIFLIEGKHNDSNELGKNIYKINPLTGDVSLCAESETGFKNPYFAGTADGLIYLVDVDNDTKTDCLNFKLYTLDAAGNLTYINGNSFYYAPDQKDHFSFTLVDGGILMAGPAKVDALTDSVIADTWLIDLSDANYKALPRIIDSGISNAVCTTVCNGDWYVLAISRDANGLIFAMEPDMLTEKQPSHNSGGSNRKPSKKEEQKETEKIEESEEITPEASENAGTAEQTGKTFADVSETDWFHDAVAFVSARGLFSGTSATDFSPYTAMTRGMLAVVLHNLKDNPAAGIEEGFDDVNGEYFANAVAWAAEAGIISGYGGGLFGPNDVITREQLAVMLYRFAGKPAVSGDALTHKDASEISGYALTAMQWAVENGILSGRDDGTLDPQGQASRAEVASMLMRFCRNLNL